MQGGGWIVNIKFGILSYFFFLSFFVCLFCFFLAISGFVIPESRISESCIGEARRGEGTGGNGMGWDGMGFWRADASRV